MLVREPFRANFYDIVRRKHVVLVVANDIDALCSSSILMHLFSCDDVAYSVVPVSNWTSLEKTLQEHFEQGSNFVLFNCGATRAMSDMPIPPACTVFIVDSRRPLDVDNVYSDDGQIRVVCIGKEVDQELKIPRADEIFAAESENDDEDEEEEGDEDDDEGIDENAAGRHRKRMENMERRVLKNEEKKRWEARRGNLLWDYYENSWTSTASSVVMLQVAAELSRATVELVWVTAIAISSQLSAGDIGNDAYTLTCLDYMKPYITKFAPAKNAIAKADDLLRIRFERELPLPLYQHWSLLQAMKVNEFFSCKTRNWTQRGEHDMKHLLANIGLTLNECRQKYTSMTLERRKEVVSLLEAAMETKFASFFVHLGFNERVSAFDVARALGCWLDGCPSKLLTDRFEDCRALLRSFLTASTDMSQLHKMIGVTKSELEGIWTNVGIAINQAEIIPNGHFYLFSPQRPRESCLLSRPALLTFSHFLATAFSVSKKGRNSRPLVVALPYEEEGWQLVLGIMPLATSYADSHLKSFMGRAFERAAKQPRISVRREFFDPNMILLKNEDRLRFFDQLQTLLETV